MEIQVDGLILAGAGRSEVDRAAKLGEIVAGAGRARRKGKVNSNLTMIVILVTVIHVAALAVMIWIRVRRSEADDTPGETASITPCALCGESATGWSYDGLDPNEQRDPRTGRAWSADMAHYRPVCAAH